MQEEFTSGPMLTQAAAKRQSARAPQARFLFFQSGAASNVNGEIFAGVGAGTAKLLTRVLLRP